MVKLFPFTIQHKVYTQNNADEHEHMGRAPWICTSFCSGFSHGWLLFALGRNKKNSVKTAYAPHMIRFIACICAYVVLRVKTHVLLSLFLHIPRLFIVKYSKSYHWISSQCPLFLIHVAWRQRGCIYIKLFSQINCECRERRVILIALVHVINCAT